MTGLQAKYVTATLVEIRMDGAIVGEHTRYICTIWINMPGHADLVGRIQDYEIAKMLADLLALRLHIPIRDRVKEWLDEQQR